MSPIGIEVMSGSPDGRKFNFHQADIFVSDFLSFAVAFWVFQHRQKLSPLNW
jgi:hypothetical protein